MDYGPGNQVKRDEPPPGELDRLGTGVCVSALVTITPLRTLLTDILTWLPLGLRLYGERADRRGPQRDPLFIYVCSIPLVVLPQLTDTVVPGLWTYTYWS